MSTPSIHRGLFLLLLCICLSIQICAQPAAPTVKEWRQQMASRRDDGNRNYQRISDRLNRRDTAFVLSVLKGMETDVPLNHHYNARFFCLKAEQTTRLLYLKVKSSVQQYLDRALDEAYRSSDDYLISFVCQEYGKIMYDYQELEISTTYYLKAAEIEERLNQDVSSPYFVWFRLGVALFHIREYEKSIYYIQKGLDRWTDTSALSDQFRTSYLNAIGQDYQQLGQFDSALAVYARSIELAKKRNDLVWPAIDNSFLGQVYFELKQFARAKPLLIDAYDSTKNFDYNIAANTLQWLSRIYLVEGKKDSALLRSTEAFQLLASSNSFPLQNREYTQHAYLTMANTQLAFGRADSFYHYFQLYSSLHDSLERVVALGSLKIAEMRIANEKNYQKIQSLETEKKVALLIRNLFITAAVLLIIIALMYNNRRTLKYRHREQMVLKEKEAAQAEIAFAREQLRLITESVIEKTNLLEKVEQEVQSNRFSEEQYKMIDAISHLTILTEEEWRNFRMLFEKIYPGFFSRLKDRAPNITVAEQRMAALTRLRLTPKQMAAMLGISVDSVHKARQRLRQRLNLAADLNLEQSITSF
jgi:tetratricopeptide (TPR) repeat protein